MDRCSTIFLDLANLSAITIALPTIEKEFGVKIGDLQWVISAYALTVCELKLWKPLACTDIQSSARFYYSVVEAVIFLGRQRPISYFEVSNTTNYAWWPQSSHARYFWNVFLRPLHSYLWIGSDLYRAGHCARVSRHRGSIYNSLCTSLYIFDVPGSKG